MQLFVGPLCAARTNSTHTRKRGRPPRARPVANPVPRHARQSHAQKHKQTPPNVYHNTIPPPHTFPLLQPHQPEDNVPDGIHPNQKLSEIHPDELNSTIEDDDGLEFVDDASAAGGHEERRTNRAPICDADVRKRVLELAARRGAMGRGVRACLRALYRRARGLDSGSGLAAVYVECGPAYVLATALLGHPEHVTRYSVETIAWPALRKILQWEEVQLHEARARGARLRLLVEGGRYGRHLFFQPKALRAACDAAEQLFKELQTDTREAEKYATAEPWVGSDVEAVIHLRKIPEPGRRTVGVRCPRAHMHKNKDRRPSCILWMNNDGVTGGAMCPVCTEETASSSLSTAVSNEPHRFLTWRVLYLSGQRAALCSPRRRAHLSLQAMCAPAGGACVDAVTAATKPGEAASNTPVGGCVLKERRHDIGKTQDLAYITATLKASATEEGVAARARSMGTVARQEDPLQALLWSDGRAKGEAARTRAEETAWYAAAALGEESCELALPTRVLSISAMRPASWRDLLAPNGKPVRVPDRWEPAAQAWIVFDLDDITHIPSHAVSLAAQRIVAVLRRDNELSGRAAVVQTGPHGLHVWAELREVRSHPREWFANADTRVWYEAMGKRVLAAARKVGCAGGKVDMACCAAGRFARRPGWRVLQNGDLFRSTVITVAANKVKKRAPRV